MNTYTQSSIILTEKYYNMKVIDKLLSVNTNLPGYDDEFMWSNEQNKLREIKNNQINDCQKVEYKMKEYGVGRMYPIPYINTYQSMYNVIRRLVIDGNLTSIDLVNCQPTFLVQLCEKYDFFPKYLRHYVNERDKVRSGIMSKCDITKDEVKHLFIVMMFGGCYKKWFIDKNLKVPDCKFLQELDEELNGISVGLAPTCFPNYDKFLYIARKKQSKSLSENKEKIDEGAVGRSAISLYLQDTERQVIQHLIDHAKNNNVEVVSIIHDEILIDSKSTLDLEEAQIYILDQTINEVNFDVKFESKITLPTKEDLEWLEKHEPFITENNFNEIEKVRNAVMGLNKERAVDYTKCMQVIFAIGGELNYSPDGREIAHEFSKQSDKYDKAWVDKLYKPSKNGSSLKMGSIMKWLQEDKPLKKIEFQNDEEDK